MSNEQQRECSSRVLLTAALLCALVLVGGLQRSTRLGPLGPVEHVLAQRPPAIPAVIFEAPDFALVLTSRALAAPAFSRHLVLPSAPALEPWPHEFSQYIRPPPLA